MVDVYGFFFSLLFHGHFPLFLAPTSNCGNSIWGMSLAGIYSLVVTSIYNTTRFSGTRMT